MLVLSFGSRVIFWKLDLIWFSMIFFTMIKKPPYLFFSYVGSMYYKYLPCQIFSHNFDEKSDRLFELRILFTIARHYSIQKRRSSKERVGSRENVRSPYQVIITNVATWVFRRGVRGSCVVLRDVFLSTLVFEKILLWRCCVVFIGWRYKKTK